MSKNIKIGDEVEQIKVDFNGHTYIERTGVVVAEFVDHFKGRGRVLVIQDVHCESYGFIHFASEEKFKKVESTCCERFLKLIAG